MGCGRDLLHVQGNQIGVAMKVELLMTLGCHLCDDAEQIVRRALPTVVVEHVDIAESDEGIERYGTRIPVLRINGKELDWPFSLLDVRSVI
jgi:glutaredoxin-like protein DUF836